MRKMGNRGKKGKFSNKICTSPSSRVSKASQRKSFGIVAIKLNGQNGNIDGKYEN